MTARTFMVTYDRHFDLYEITGVRALAEGTYEPTRKITGVGISHNIFTMVELIPAKDELDAFQLMDKLLQLRGYTRRDEAVGNPVGKAV